MDKKRLLVTASTFPRWEDDTEPRFVLNLCQELTRYYEVTVLVPAEPRAALDEMMGDVHVIRYHYLPIHKWETLCYPGAIVPRIKEKKIRALQVPFLILGLYRKLKKMLPQFDVVHAYWIIPQGIVHSLFNKPYVVTGLGGDVTSLNIPIIQNMKRRCLIKAKNITVISESLDRYVQEMYRNNKTHVISMGCDTKRFHPQKRIDNYFGQDNKKVILFVGRFVEKKGLTYLLEAVKEFEDIILIVVGNGPLECELKEQALSLGDRVRFVGAKKHEELPEIYASADLFVAPSVTAADGDKEGLPTTIIEAMASGLAIVATRHSGIPEIIHDMENGLLVDERDVLGLKKQIERVLTSETLRTKLVKKGLEIAQEKDYRNIARKYYEILEKND